MKKTKRSSLFRPAVLIGVGAAILLNSCQTATQTGAVGGAAAGAALGAIIDDNNRGRGALIGLAAGTIAGAMTGSVVDAKRARRYEPQSTAYPVPNYGGYPFATKTETSGYVRSPHPPHNVIDVKGYQAEQP